MIRSLIKTLIYGRENGLRRRFLSQFTDVEDTSPNSAYSMSSETSGVVYGGANKMEPPKDVNPPDGYEVILHRDALQNGEVTEVIIAGRTIVVANVEGEIYALSNTCPHAGGPLGEGVMLDFTLSCPYHGWGFDVRTGVCQTNSEHSVETYNAMVVEDAICVQL